MRRLTPSRRLVLIIALLAMAIATGALLAQDQSDTSSDGPLTGTMTYTIVYGDVLDVIAARYDVSLVCLIETNGLTSTLDLKPGDTITISADCPLYTGVGVIVYPRGPHDTVVQVPGGANGAEDGQGGGGGVAPAGAGEAVYIVQPADVMDLIAAAFNEDLECIQERNNFPFRYGPIYPGDEVIIPSSCPPYAGLSQALSVGPGPQPADLTASWSRGSSGGSSQLPASATPTAAGGVVPTQELLPTQETILQTSTPAIALTVTIIMPTLPPQPTQEVLATITPIMQPTQESLATSTRPPTVTPTPMQPAVPPQQQAPLQTQEVGATG